MLGVCDLGAIFEQPENWAVSSDAFLSAHRADGFERVDDDQVSALGAEKCQWFGLPLWESRVYFGETGVARVELSLYNRGDATKTSTTFTKASFAELLEKVGQAFSEGKQSADTRKKNRSGGAQIVRRWTGCEPSGELTWGIAEDQSFDFVRLVLEPQARKSSRKPMRLSTQAAQAKVKQNVTRNAAGDVWIDHVPMVDQGQKGYCAAAVAERVLRYYGQNIDEHQIAQMAGSTAEGGTQVSEMIETVRKVGAKCRLGFTEIVSMSGSMKEIQKELAAYNKAAKRLKEPELNYDDFLEGRTFMVPRMREAMKKEVLLAMRVKDGRYKKFLAGIKKNVNAGIPVFWGVTLGIFPEAGLPQSRGGHMRLIIGYNAKTKEVLYSDTWGADHELKRMPEDVAFAITHDTFILRPL